MSSAWSQGCWASCAVGWEEGKKAQWLEREQRTAPWGHPGSPLPSVYKLLARLLFHSPLLCATS